MKEEFNSLGRKKIPFFFVIDFALKNYYIEPLETLSKDIFFKTEKFSNYDSTLLPFQSRDFFLKKKGIDFQKYNLAFAEVIKEIKLGNTYLLNLTFPTSIKTNLSLLEIFHRSQAKFKLYFQDNFISFSPERFIRIDGNVIKTYPMKGTIEANLKGADQKILEDSKEMAEHVMVVDLMRNDLSIVANQVRLDKFRFLDKIKAGEKDLWQVSSKISGFLESDWPSRVGDILEAILPAGSISGTPKKKTVEIIERVEEYERGFYTGIFGVFDGKNLDSAVMIRFIEKDPQGKFVYKSGGGITIDSQSEKEYQEMLDKVYLPF